MIYFIWLLKQRQRRIKHNILTQMGCSQPLHKKKLPYQADACDSHRLSSTQATEYVYDSQTVGDYYGKIDCDSLQSQRPTGPSKMATATSISNKTTKKSRSASRKKQINPANSTKQNLNYEQMNDFSFGPDCPAAAQASSLRYSSRIGLSSQQASLLEFVKPLNKFMQHFQDYMKRTYIKTLTLSKSMGIKYLKSALRFFLTNISRLFQLSDLEIFDEMAKAAENDVRQRLSEFSRKLWTNETIVNEECQQGVLEILEEMYKQGWEKAVTHEAYWNKVLNCLKVKFH